MKTLHWALVGLVISSPATASVDYSQKAGQIQKIQMEDEAVVSIRTPFKIRSLESLSSLEGYTEVLDLLRSGEANVILSTSDEIGHKVLVEWKVKNARDLSRLASKLQRQANVEWVKPNFRYEGEARDFINYNDPLLGKQIHHEAMQSDLAWTFTSGRADIVVAVTDDGVDIDHEDLAANIWVNSGEIPGNGIDDDGNGFIDDVNGWDFSSNDNNPRPLVSAWGGEHGTHVAGIIAAVGNNNVGVVGAAPNVKIMPIRFYGSGSWTSSVIAKSYAYAVDNGARIISTSYNIDGMADDPIFQEAVAYAYRNEVLHFNSAGNNSEKNPNRQKIDELILVCSTESKEAKRDRRSGFSNYGTGIDLCAPGSDILSTVPDDRYEWLGGTSMATPNAAGVAALIWSLHPSWTRDQVAAQLFASADNIDEINSMEPGLLGAGRVNSLRSLAFKLRPPRIDSAKVLTVSGRVVGFKVRSRSVFRADTIENSSSWLLRNAETGEIFSLSLDRPYKIGTNQFELLLDESLPPGDYKLEGISSRIKDPFNQTLDGNLDGRSGENFEYSFSVEEPSLIAEGLHANRSAWSND